MAIKHTREIPIERLVRSYRNHDVTLKIEAPGVTSIFDRFNSRLRNLISAAIKTRFQAEIEPFPDLVAEFFPAFSISLSQGATIRRDAFVVRSRSGCLAIEITPVFSKEEERKKGRGEKRRKR